MAIIPQVITEDRASGAQVIDGSFKFDSTAGGQLERTPGSAGDRTEWTWSAWIKRSGFDSTVGLFGSYAANNNTDYLEILFASANTLLVQGNSIAFLNTSQVFRDTSWYHIVIAVDTSNATADDRIKIYVNGEQITAFGTRNNPSSGGNLGVNQAGVHRLGRRPSSTDHFNGYMSQVYLVDGQALDASYFGYTDPLTNTWRPKKFDISKTPGGSWGTNGFWLPMDGNSLIGEDKSGNGNNWTPVNFGGFNTIEKATGALPILNTVGGGAVASAFPRLDEYASSLVLAQPFAYTAAVQDISYQINSGSTQKSITLSGNTAGGYNTGSPFYNSSVIFDGTGDYMDIGSSSDFDIGTGDFTIEFWMFSGTNSLDTFYRRLWMTDGPTGNAVNNFQIAIVPTSGVINLWDDGTLDLVGTTNVTNSKWHHIAAVRSGTTLKIFVDGVMEASTTFSGAVSPNSGTPRPRIGSYNGTSGDYNGYLNDLRVYVGVAKYSNNFVPASSDPDILPDTPSGVAYGSELKQITEGSVNGGVSTGDTLLVGNSSDFSFGSGDFTVELFAYHTSTAGNDTLVGVWNSGSNRRSWMIDIEADQGRLRGYWSTDGSAVSNVQTVTGYISRHKWNHIVFCRQGNTMRLYLNGNQEATATESSSLYNNVTDSLGILSATDAGNDPCKGHISNVRILKGTCLYPDGTSFTPPSAPLTNVTDTVLLACQSPTSATAYEVSPGTITTSGSVSASAFNPFNDDINTARGQESLYCTLNPLEKNSKFTLSKNNLKFTNGTNNWTGWIGGTQTFKTGKWYWEVRIDVSTQYHIFGIVNTTLGSISAADTYQYAMAYQTDGRFYAENNGTASFSTGNQTAQTVGDICSIAVDMDNKKMWLGINGQWTGGANPSIGYLANWDSTRGFTDGDTYMPVFMSYGSSGQTVNFGQKPFKFPPPDGFQPLCLNNLPRPTKGAVRPDKHFNTMVWSGDDTTRSMTGLGFRPDLVWIKCRTLGAFHNFTDSVRGPKVIIQSNTVTGEQKPTTHNGAIDSFDPDGFTLGTGLSYGDVNQSGRDYVGWAWKGGTPENYTTPCGSVLFDGTGDYLDLSVSSDFQFGSGDFTIECWAKAFDQGTDDILGIYNTGDNRRTFALRKDQSESVQFLYSTNGSSGASVSSSAGVIKLATWHHYAVVRDNLVYRIYLDGVLVATDSSSTDAIYTNNDDGLRIGSSYNTDFDGQISNVRIVKGTALYTSNFTPSSAPLTNVTNTKLLCCQSATSASAAAVAPGTFVNNGTNYSSNNQVTGSAGLVNVDSIFNGHLRASGVPSLNEGATVSLSSDNYILWTPTTGIPYSSKVEIYCYAPNGYSITNYYTFNGGTETTFVGGAANYNGNAWITVATGSGTINSIKLRLTRGGGNQSQATWYAVRVDGTILLNDQNGKSIGRYDNPTPTTHNPFDNYRVDGRVYATAAEAGLTAGTKASLLSGASVNTESGFSILTWTGDGANSNLQIPHGLPSRPLMVAVKKRNEAVDDWYIAHDGLDGNNYAYRMFWGPNGTSTKNGNQGTTNPYYLANQVNDALVLNNTTTYGGGNEDNIAYVAYCWSEVPGFSKFSTYEGTANGGADGPFIECGFKPAFVLIKADDVASSWYLFDDVRESIQTQGSDAQVLFPDTAAVEDANAGQGIDFLSNGFKVRAANGYGINNQVTYVYAAFAEAPTTNLYGGQANAR